MNNDILLAKLITRAGEMAMANNWGEKSFKINMMILEIDSTNSAACTRLAKYFKLHDNLIEAKKMYSKALEINPQNQGAKNNLIEIEKHEGEKDFVDKLKVGRDANDAARTFAQQGKYELSIKCLLKAYSIEPVLKYAVNLAKIYNKIGRYEDVRKLYHQILGDNQSSKDIDAINSEFGVLLQR